MAGPPPARREFTETPSEPLAPPPSGRRRYASRRMVVHDPPPFLAVVEDQREPAVRRIGFARQLPGTGDDDIVIAEGSQIDVGEHQRSHLGAGVVLRLVAIANLRPAARDVGA